MKKLLLLLLLSLSLIPLAQAQENILDGLESEDALGRLFVQAFQKKDFKKLKSSFVPAELYPKISPNETQGKSEAELLKDKEVVEKRIQSKWDILKVEAKFHKIKKSNLQFQETILQEIPMQQGMLFGLDIITKYSQKTLTFTLIVVQNNERWYLLDIAMQSDIFDDL
jgi:hypothetical protein